LYRFFGVKECCPVSGECVCPQWLFSPQMQLGFWRYLLGIYEKRV
jgi:hypothetical protein